MLSLQRSSERRYVRTESQEMWMSFDASDPAKPFHRGFRSLDSLNEVKLLPGAKLQLQTDEDRDSLTYIREGRLVVRRPERKPEILGPGFCHRASTRLPLEVEPPADPGSPCVHLFVSLLAAERPERYAGCERRHYPFSGRRGTLRLIASPDGAEGSLQVRKDVRVYSSTMDPGHHVVHPLGLGRGAWLHIVAGSVRLFDQILETGDGASLEEAPAISFTAREASEILLFDLA